MRHWLGSSATRSWLTGCTADCARSGLRNCVAAGHSPAVDRGAKQPTARPSAHRAPRPNRDARHDGAVGPSLPAVADLARLEARFEIAFELVNPDAIDIVGIDADPDPTAFLLRGELVRLSLFEGFDELLCLPALQGVEAHWYQVETVRKVLKQYRGSGAAGRRGRARQDHRGRDGAEGIHPARHGRTHPDPDPGLAGRAMARRNGEQVRHRLRHQPRPSAAQRPRGLLGAAARDCLDRGGAPARSRPNCLPD